MEFVQLGEDGPTVSRVAFGCYSMGGPGHRGWAGIDDDESIAAVHAALDRGVNFFDNAALYGLGHAEEVLAKALAGMRQDVVIASKCGTWREDIWQELHDRDSSPARIRQDCEDSLRRLKTDYIDLFLIHWPDATVPFADSMEAMLDLRAQGKVRFVGVCNYSVEQMEASLEAGQFTVSQPKYNMLASDAEKDILPFCKEHGIGVMGYSTLASGLLSGHYSESTAFGEDDWRTRYGPFKGPELRRQVAIVERLKAIAERNGRTVLELATAWSLMSIDVAIVGLKRPTHVAHGAIDAVGWTISEEDMAAIDAVRSRGGKG